jgi:hypothetical protein
MEIKTRHRKSAEQAKPKGRALFALAERKEAPFAAMFAALTLTLAAYVKTAFGGSPQTGEEAEQPHARHDDSQPAPHQLANDGEVGPVDLAEDAQAEEPIITGSLPGDSDLGRIGRGPGPLDLSRFFPDADLDMKLPHDYLVDMPDIETAQLGPMPGARMPVIATPGGGGGGGGNTGGGGGNNGGGNTDGGDEDGIVGPNFHALFAQLASVVRPFHPTTVKDISNAAIGDWITQHELYKLRGGETRPDLDQAYLAREERTYDMVKNPESRDAFIDQHFPTLSTGMPEASLSETLADAGAALAPTTLPEPDPLLDMNTNTGLL